MMLVVMVVMVSKDMKSESSHIYIRRRHIHSDNGSSRRKARQYTSAFDLLMYPDLPRNQQYLSASLQVLSPSETGHT
jgi:hypothetical protein